MTSRLQRIVLGLLIAAVLAVGAAAALIDGGDDDGDVAAPTTTSSAAGSTSTAPPTATTLLPTTTTEPPVVWPAVAGDGVARAVRTPGGIVLAVRGVRPDGSYLAVSPCGNDVVVSGEGIAGAHVVLDPGHGGEEPGAVGPGGTTEKAVNLAIAQEAKRRLETLGATVVLTRTSDYRITLASRGLIATQLAPAVFISIHHNADPDEARPTPGSETYFQIESPESRRASGLLYEELLAALSAYDIEWAADRDAGAKYRPNSSGGDYYGILKRTAGVPAVLSEAAFISNPAEEALLADPAFQAVEAEAITEAVVRFVNGDQPADAAFVEPYPRTQPAGPGGGSGGCEDPPLD